MFDFFRKFPWVLEPVRYRNQKALIAGLRPKVIAPDQYTCHLQGHPCPKVLFDQSQRELHTGCYPCGGVRVPIAYVDWVRFDIFLPDPLPTCNVSQHVCRSGARPKQVGRLRYRWIRCVALAERSFATREVILCDAQRFSRPLPPATSRVSIGPQRVRKVSLPDSSSPQFVCTDLRRVVLASSTFIRCLLCWVFPDVDLRCPNKDLKWARHVDDLSAWSRNKDDWFLGCP